MRWDELARLVDFNTLLSTLGWVLLGLLTAAEKLAPEGKKPWSALARAVGRELNRDMREHMDEIDKRLSALAEKLDAVQSFGEETRVCEARARILRFGDEMLRDQRHSKDSFDQIIMDINAYDVYCEEHPDFKNHVTGTTAHVIKEQYEDCMKKRSFNERRNENE